jgi:ferric iron reductase protein FhuF
MSVTQQNLDDALEHLQTVDGRQPTNLSKPISVYDTEIIKRGAGEVTLSVASMNMVHYWATLMEAPVMIIGIAWANWRSNSNKYFEDLDCQHK